MNRTIRGVLLTAGILAVTAGSAWAQANGSIFGRVTDPSGGVLPGATVTVTGTGLQRPLVATTTASGAYQFPVVPIGTYTVTFELSSFKRATRPNVIIETGFNAEINQRLEIGALTEELTVSGASPVVDTKKTTTGAVFTKEILENIPTARDPWQIINMTPGVIAGLNVGGHSSGQQVGLQVYGTSGSVQWNLEGGSITDLSSNSSPAYYNFDAFEQIQVVTGGGDVSVQSGGLSINLVTKSGSNVFKGSAVTTYQNADMQGRNVSRELFYSGSGGFISGAPIKKIQNMSAEYGGPIQRNRLWWWGAIDKQDINAGVVNFFDVSLGSQCATYADAQRLGSAALAAAITYEKLAEVQKCLFNDKTVLKNLNWKFNYQLNASNKIQYLFSSDNKIRTSRGASASTAKEATTRQFSDGKLPIPITSFTHTLIVTDRLVFNNQYTYTGGGFFLDYQDYERCGTSRYTGSDQTLSYTSDRTCMFNIQPQTIRHSGFNSRSLGSSYQTKRPGTEIKTEGTYFLTNFLGGDHSLKFGAGYRNNPVQSFSHVSGGGRAQVQCVGNNANNCGTGAYVPVGSAAGLVPWQANLGRDSLANSDWWSYSGFLQDSYSRGRWRINGGLRYDWQRSKFLGGCVIENEIRPDLLPSQCQEASDTDPLSGRRLQSFANWSPRISVTYDLRGDGKTSIKGAFSYYFQTRQNLAGTLSTLGGITLTWGQNQTSGACSTTAGASCWTDANGDGFIQANELIGIPSVPAAIASRFNTTTGALTPVGNNVDPSAKIGRTREGIVGVQHELMPNLAVGVEYIVRRYDNGTFSYTIGYEPGASGFPLSQIYTGPLTYTDPVTGFSAPYFVICTGCMRPSGVGSITMTDLSYNHYQGLSFTANKRFSDKWQFNGSVMLQQNPNTFPPGSYVNPTDVRFLDQESTLQRWVLKLQGSYVLPWDITVSGNFNMNDGGNRTMTINGPGQVYGGINAAGGNTTINYSSLEFEPRGSTRFGSAPLLDVGAHKVVSFAGGKYRVKFMADAFNIQNTATVLAYVGNNLSLATSRNPRDIVPPRVFRFGLQVHF